MMLFKVKTFCGETQKLKTTYQEARRALDHAGTVVLIGTNLNNRRVFIPIASIDSITEVFDDVN